jgi:ribonuclease HI
LGSLEYIENIQTEDKTVTIYTDSQMTLDSLKNNTYHTFLIEEMWKKLAEMGTTNWTIEFCWVKAHVGIQGNELADTCKGGSDECGPYREIQESPKECSDE